MYYFHKKKYVKLIQVKNMYNLSGKCWLLHEVPEQTFHDFIFLEKDSIPSHPPSPPPQPLSPGHHPSPKIQWPQYWPWCKPEIIKVATRFAPTRMGPGLAQWWKFALSTNYDVIYSSTICYCTGTTFYPVLSMVKICTVAYPIHHNLSQVITSERYSVLLIKESY